MLLTVAQPRYPQIRVSLASANPLALVGAVREALRQAGIDRDEIHRFSDQALNSASCERLCQVCREWVRVEMPRFSGN